MRRLPVFISVVMVGAGLLLSGCPRIGVVNDVTTHHFRVIEVAEGVYDYETEWAFQVYNTAKLGNTELVFAVTADQPWILVDPVGGISTGEDDPVTINVTIDRDYVEPTEKALGFAAGRITIAAGDMDRCIDVTTAPDYFTYVLDGAQDLNNLQVAFIPTGGPSFYRQEANAITGFPTDPTDGLVLDFEAFGDPILAGLLFGGQTVPFYGENFSTLYISSEGWISFGAEGSGTDSAGEHFAATQISAFPVDATAMGSQVSYLQEEDRLVITYENAPTAGTAAACNDFQIEMLFNGDIRLNYVNVDPAVAGVIGLSSGTGQNGEVPDDFLESNLNTDTVKVALD